MGHIPAEDSAIYEAKPAEAPSHDPSEETKVKELDLTTYPLPLGPLVDDIALQGVKGEPLPNGTFAYAYPSKRDRDFSAIIQTP